MCGRRVRRTARNEVAKKSAATARRATQFNDARQTTWPRGNTWDRNAFLRKALRRDTKLEPMHPQVWWKAIGGPIQNRIRSNC